MGITMKPLVAKKDDVSYYSDNDYHKFQRQCPFCEILSAIFGNIQYNTIHGLNSIYSKSVTE